MATLAQLSADVAGWLDRRDVEPLIPGWIAMAEADMRQMLRARCMVVKATQQIDAPLISLPADFATMASIRDLTTGKLLKLEDDFTGPLYGDGSCPVTSYRLQGDCIEFLPHPFIPDPPLLSWVPQPVEMTWFRAPKPLRDPQDTNPVLEQHYAVYLFGTCKYGGMFELDDDRATQMKTAFIEAVTAVNLWFETSTYSGAPLRAAPPARAF